MTHQSERVFLSRNAAKGVGLLAALAILVAFTPIAVTAQVAVTTEDVNLRPNHTTHDPPLRALLKSDTLALLAPDTTNGFVHVRTRDDSTVGWVYGRYVVVVSAPTVGAPPPSGCAGARVTHAGHECSVQLPRLSERRAQQFRAHTRRVDPSAQSVEESLHDTCSLGDRQGHLARGAPGAG